MEEAEASFTEKNKHCLCKTQILFTVPNSLSLLAVDVMTRRCNVSVRPLPSRPCDTPFISLFTNVFYFR